MLDIEIIPEKSISTEKWQIILGMPMYQVIHILKSNCEAIKTVQLIYNDKVNMCSFVHRVLQDVYL
jgi:ATP-dependent Clp protease adapter protein ClpS